jgi:Mrp family chromosome partitioning ATPase
MELRYLSSVLRRRWWLVLIGLVVGLIAGLVFGSGNGSLYEARAVLLIQPPQNVLGGAIFNADPDRYVIGQITVLDSSSLAERVATASSGRNTEDIQRAVVISHEPKTDIVTVAVQLNDASEAERIANLYVNTYISDLKKAAGNQQTPLVTQIDARLVEITKQLAVQEATLGQNAAIIQQANLQLNSVLSAPNPNVALANELRQKIDAAIQESARIESQRQSLIAQNAEALRTKSQVEVAASFKVGSEVVQPAVTPTVPLRSSSKLAVPAGAVLGLLFGLALALLAARYSGKVVDTREIEDRFGVPVFGELPRAGGMSPLADLLDQVPDSIAAVVDQLCVRAEARAEPDHALTVAVVGSMRPAGVTSLAVAMASRFAVLGSSVVLIDGDPADGQITRELAPTSPGVRALLANPAPPRTDVRRSGEVFNDPFVRYGQVSVLGLGPRSGRSSLRRSEIAEVLEAAAHHAHVIVIDGGELLDSASSVELARIADAVVVAVPERFQQLEDLDDVADELRARGRDILPVITHPSTGKPTRVVDITPVTSQNGAASTSTSSTTTSRVRSTVDIDN